MQDLVVVIMLWLTVNFDLPKVDAHPRVELVTEAEMSMIRAERVAEASHSGNPQFATVESSVNAQYDDAMGTIYLNEDWSAGSLADVSILVHEIVHHMQALSGLQYDCPGAREKLAYVAQSRWLELFGRSLMDEFGLDPMTVLVRTNCL